MPIIANTNNNNTKPPTAPTIIAVDKFVVAVLESINKTVFWIDVVVDSVVAVANELLFESTVVCAPDDLLFDVSDAAVAGCVEFVVFSTTETTDVAGEIKVLAVVIVVGIGDVTADDVGSTKSSGMVLVAAALIGKPLSV